MPRIATALITLLLLTAGLTVSAEQSKTFGDYTIHYVAFTTDMLSPEVARLYKIRRSKNLGHSQYFRAQEGHGNDGSAGQGTGGSYCDQPDPAVKTPEYPGIKR